MRSPEIGNAYVPTIPYKEEWTGDNSIRSPQGMSTNSGNNGVYFCGNSGQYKPPLGSRNPQTPSDGGEFGWTLRSGERTPGAPQGQQQQALALSSQDHSQSNSRSHYVVDQTQYQDQSKLLVRMMDNIRAEQEELERGRLEYEALTQNYRGGDPHSQSYYQPLPPPPPPK